MRRRPGFTLVEALVALGVATVVAVLAYVVLGSSRQPLATGTERAARVAQLRLAVDKAERELRTARQVLFPQPRTDGVPTTPERLLIFRDFQGRFVLYAFEPSARELRRTVLPLDGLPAEDREPLATGLSEGLFTVSHRRLVSVLLVRDGVPVLTSIRMVNG